jgi:hypothetical protein
LFRSKVPPVLKKQNNPYIIIGRGALNSAIIGAVIEEILATILQAPNTLELYANGKYSAVTR